MARTVRSTDLYQSLNADWLRRCNTRQWKHDVTQLVSEAKQPELNQLDPAAVARLIDRLGGGNGDRYLDQHSRQLIGYIVDLAAVNSTAMRIGLQAVLTSVDGYWWPLKFRSFDAESALSEVMMFTYIELSDRKKVGTHRRDPLACVRTNATNRALSSMRSHQRRTPDPLPTTVLECRGHAEKPVNQLQETLKLMMSDISSESGHSDLYAASFVLHKGFGLSFRDLARSSQDSKATHHRRSQQVENALKKKYCQV